MIDKLNVTPGYENALDALLGDELYYSTNEKNPIYWKLLDEIEEGHELPNSCEPLSNYVKGSDALKRRLNQTGIINKEDGMKLISRLKYGQRLVSKEGDLWRWDGLVVTSTSSSSASVGKIFLYSLLIIFEVRWRFFALL